MTGVQTCALPILFKSHVKYLEKVENIFTNYNVLSEVLKGNITDIYIKFFKNSSGVLLDKEAFHLISNRIVDIVPPNHFNGKGLFRQLFVKIFGIKSYLKLLVFWKKKA